MMLFLGGFETANYVRASLRVEAAANSIAEMISQAPASASAAVPGDGTVSDSQMHFFWDSMQATLPDAVTEAAQLHKNWWDLATLSVWSVEFKQTSSSTYTPNVVWSWNAAVGCGDTITQVPDNSTITAKTLPASVYGPGSLIVVQVSYSYYPTFGASLFGSATITRTALLAPRNVPLVESAFTWTITGNCPGTPF